jgi:hypothetical protein
MEAGFGNVGNAYDAYVVRLIEEDQRENVLI